MKTTSKHINGPSSVLLGVGDWSYEVWSYSVVVLLENKINVKAMYTLHVQVLGSTGDGINERKHSS